MINPIDTIRRRRNLDKLLRTSGLTSQKEFAESYSVDVRTLFNDFLWLESQGCEIAKRGRFRIYVDIDCPSPFALSEEQTMAFLLGHTALCQYGGSAFEPEAKELYSLMLDKILDPDLRDSIRSMESSVKFRTGHITGNLDRSVVHALFTAYLSRKAVTISYRKAGCQPEPRMVHPYTFVNEAGEWSLLAWYPQREKILQFKISRIESVVQLDETFTISEEYDPGDFLNQGFDNWTDGKSYQFVIRFDAKTAPHVDTRFHHETQEVTQLEDGGCEIRFESEGLPAVTRWVLGFGAGAMVVEPEELRVRIREEISILNKIYKPE